MANKKNALCQSGQIFPLALIFLFLIFAIVMAVIRTLLTNLQDLSEAESYFQSEFLDELADTYRLNAISRNNRTMSDVLQKLLTLYLNATGFGLDLAASTPLWEKKLPIPIPENVFVNYHLSRLPGTFVLKSIASDSRKIRESLPTTLQAKIRQLSLSQSLCLFNESQEGQMFERFERFESLRDCEPMIQSSLLAAPQFRRLQSIRSLTQSIGSADGFLLIDINSSEIFRSDNDNSHLKNRKKPFDHLRISLTHGSFCPVQAIQRMKTHCPSTQSSRSRSIQRPQFAAPSFDPNWTVLVERVPTHER